MSVCSYLCLLYNLQISDWWFKIAVKFRVTTSLFDRGNVTNRNSPVYVRQGYYPQCFRVVWGETNWTLLYSSLWTWRKKVNIFHFWLNKINSEGLRLSWVVTHSYIIQAVQTDRHRYYTVQTVCTPHRQQSMYYVNYFLICPPPSLLLCVWLMNHFPMMTFI